MKKVDIIVDLQYGSTGKGLIAGVLAKERGYDMVINANMPNAGHTFIDKTGRIFMHKVLPNGVVSPSVKKIMIGPGSIFSAARLKDEIDHCQAEGISVESKLIIHEGAICLLPEDTIHEKQNWAMANIASTQQGTMPAMIRKLGRNGSIGTTNTAELGKYGLAGRVVMDGMWQEYIRSAKNILIEGAQGHSLGINTQFYPYTTSRDCTPARFFADCGVPIQYLRKVIGTARTYPIRVGGTSGGHYSDQEETTWAAIGQEEERTTVTNRIRRVFTFSRRQMVESIRACLPDEIFLNFCNYCEHDIEEHIVDMINGVCDDYNPGARIHWCGWGPAETDVRSVIR